MLIFTVLGYFCLFNHLSPFSIATESEAVPEDEHDQIDEHNEDQNIGTTIANSFESYEQQVNASTASFADMDAIQQESSRESTESLSNACKCMDYWTCIRTGGEPHSYCGLTAVCCMFDGESIDDSKQSADQLADESSVTESLHQCGMKGSHQNFKLVVDTKDQESVQKSSDSPWYAMILDTNNAFVCSGSIIDAKWILTSARCVENYNLASGLKVRLRKQDLSQTDPADNYAKDHQITEINIHPQYNSQKLINDIALIKLNQSTSSKSLNTGPVCLPDARLSTDDDLGNNCIAAGWCNDCEERSEDLLPLKELPVQLWNQSACNHGLRKVLGTNHRLTDVMFCADQSVQDLCENYVGSPLVCEKDSVWYQIGIISFGLGCDQQDIPPIYTRVATYLDWIHHHIDS